jgi:hypothetical protein
MPHLVAGEPGISVAVNVVAIRSVAAIRSVVAIISVVAISPEGANLIV